MTRCSSVPALVDIGLDAAMVLLKPLDSDRSGIGIMAVRRDPCRRDTSHRLGQSKSPPHGATVRRLASPTSNVGVGSNNCRTFLLPVADNVPEPGVLQQLDVEVKTTNNSEEVIIKEG